PRQRRVELRAALPAAAVADGAAAAGNHARDQRRFRHRREGPRAARPGRTARHAPDRPGRVPRRRPGPRRRPAAAGARTRRTPAARSPGDRRPAGRTLDRRRGALRLGLGPDSGVAQGFAPGRGVRHSRADTGTASMTQKIPLLIDTDPGVDDALALLMAFADTRHEVVGLTIAAGNVGLHHTVANALKLCEVAGRGDVP